MAIQAVTVSFTGAEDSVPATWPSMSTPAVVAFGQEVADGGGPTAIDFTGVGATGCTVVTGGRFAGSVNLVAMDV